MPTRLEQQVAFLKEIDRLKAVYRRTVLIDRSRLENSAEHSWHLAVMGSRRPAVCPLLPPDLETDLRALREEFEAGETLEAKYANALDRFSGLLQNWAGSDGGTWRRHGVTREAVLRRMEPIREGVPALWPFVSEVVEVATAADFITPGRDALRGIG
jgi:5'-deoxynucleotidase YfbR-like HD superfamily hydrolase